ncbi:MAG: DUF4097 domain-containing protein, partial [Candidatus Eremiobacteraeota bacterium]|nr:DUF4097 domain-containing protein [Candidatus Eremiobacteraeota bacterium]
SYNVRVGSLRWQQAAAALLLVFAVLAAVRTTARADSTRIATGASPVLFIQLTSGDLTVRSWDQQGVQIDADPGVEARHVEPQQATPRIPTHMYLWSQVARAPDGTTLKLEPETFLLPPIEGQHDAVVIRGAGNATIAIPAGTALIVSNVRRGAVAIEGYKNGVFVAHVANGSMHLDNVSGTGAVQVNNGPFTARNSDFARLRVRTVRGNIAFEHCNSTQIEATSLTGGFMYDNGTFQPGLARFESDRGNVLLGVTGSGVQVGAHSNVGQIFSDSAAVQPGQTDAQATLGRGGPVVTATSGSGSVIFYNGALRSHPALARRFALRGRHSQQKPPQNGHVHLKSMLR